MASHVASATIRHHQQETKSHKAQSKVLHQNAQNGGENNITYENGAVYASTPVNSDLGSISEIPGAEEAAFEICLSNENRRFTPASSSTPLKDNYPLPTNSCYKARSYTQSSSTCSTDTESTSSPIGDAPSSATSSVASLTNGQQFIAPILGYEILEQRARFTVFKIHVQRIETQESWFVFRRFTDFARLNRRLRGLFPTVRFPLPPKRWFKDNFDPVFLDERVQGLQSFVNHLLSRREICESHHVRDFFCFDDPPGPDDCLEESRLRCETLEDMVATLRLELTEKQAEIDAVRAELALTKGQREILLKSLRMEHKVINSQRSPNNVDAFSSNFQSSSANRFHVTKSQIGKDASGNDFQIDSCDDSYITATQSNDEDGTSRRETLIEEKSGESTSGQPLELAEQVKDIAVSSESIDLGDCNHSDSIRLRKYPYSNGSPADLPATTDSNGNQTFAKPVGLRPQGTVR